MAEHLFSYFIEKTEHPIFFFNNHGNLIYLNFKAKEMFHIHEAKGKNTNIKTVLSPKYFSTSINALNEMANQKTFIIRSTFHYQTDVDKIPVEIESFPLKDTRKKNAGRAIIVRDISIFQSLIEAHHRRSEEYKILNKLSNMVMSTLDRSEICHKVLDIVDSMFPLGGFFIATFEGIKKKFLRYIIQSDIVNNKRIFEPLDKQFPVKKFQYKKYLKQKESRILFRTEEEVKKILKLSDPDVIFGDKNRISRSIVTIPLKISDEVIGIMSVQSYEPDAFSESDILFLETLASHVAISISNARTFSELSKQINKLIVIQNILTRISSVNDEKSLGKLVSENISKTLSYDGFYFFIHNHKKDVFEGKYCTDLNEANYRIEINGIELPLMNNSFFQYLKKGSIFQGQRSRQIQDYLIMHNVYDFKKSIIIPFMYLNSLNGFLILTFKSDEFEHKNLSLFIKTITQIINFALFSMRAVKKTVKTMKYLDETQKQLMHSSKMVAVGTLASGIAHEFNNLLVGILSYADFAKSQKEIRKIKNSLEVISASAERAKSIANNLLIFARGQALKKEYAKPEKIIEDTLTLLRLELERNKIQVQFCVSDTPEIFVDANQLSQVFFNMILNAIDAMKGKPGKLKISLKYVAENEKCPFYEDIHKGQSKHCLVVRFEDNGAGIPQDIQERIFDPFYSTKPPGKGTGLGLSVSYSIIKSHKGKIFVDSEVGKGTTFSICVPYQSDTKSDENSATEIKLDGKVNEQASHYLNTIFYDE